MKTYKKPEIEIILTQHLMQQSELTQSGYNGETIEVEAKPNDPFLYDLWEDNTDEDWLKDNDN